MVFVGEKTACCLRQSPLCRGVAGLLENLPLKKLRNFGGKLGHELEAMGASTVGQVSERGLPKQDFPNSNLTSQI